MREFTVTGILSVTLLHKRLIAITSAIIVMSTDTIRLPKLYYVGPTEIDSNEIPFLRFNRNIMFEFVSLVKLIIALFLRCLRRVTVYLLN